MEKSSIPVLRKVEGNDNIENITPINDAQFLIGKSWDASLRLIGSDILEKHCTIEKVDAEKWTVVCHGNASTALNNESLSRGLPKMLNYGDFIRISPNILFKLERSSVGGNDCTQISSIRNRPGKRDDPNSTSPVTDFSSPINLNSHYKELCNENFGLSKRLKTLEGSAEFWKSEINRMDAYCSLQANSYNALMQKYSQLSEVKEELKEHQSSDVKFLNGIVTTQYSTIERLQDELKRLQENLDSIEIYKNSLEGTNQHLNNENVTLRAKIAQYIENAQSLSNENVDLQQEIAELKEKRCELESALHSRIKEVDTGTCCIRNADKNISLLNNNCEAVLEVKSKLTELLETEFKCTICDEVFVEAVVTNCGHLFCEYCLNTWKVIKPNCPICRCILTRETKALAVHSYLTNIMPFASDQLKNSWLKAVEERKQKVTSRKRKYSNAFLNPSSSGNPYMSHLEYALLHVYDRLRRYSDINDNNSSFINLTSDGSN